MQNQSRGFVAGLIVGVLASLVGFILFGPAAGKSPPPTPEQASGFTMRR